MDMLTVKSFTFLLKSIPRYRENKVLCHETGSSKHDDKYSYNAGDYPQI